MSSADKWHILFRFATQRWGVVTIEDARRLGIPDSTIHHRRRREQWRRVGAGVFLLPGFPVTPQALQVAALACCGRNATLSHATALALQPASMAGGPAASASTS